MNIMSFDELNQLNIERRSLPYEKYFGEMELTEEQKKERIAFARDIESEIMFVVSLILSMLDRMQVDIDYAKQELYERYLSVYTDYGMYSPQIDAYIKMVSAEIVEATFLNIENPYFYSMDRVMFTAENESNTSLNYVDYHKAIQSGKTRKIWVDKKDMRERKTHLAVGSKEIPIEELFHVGDSELLFPKDTSHGASAKEIVNCRCVAKYR